MPRQKFTDQDKQELSAWFQRRWEAQFAFGPSFSGAANSAALRAFWSMSHVAFANPQALDATNNGNHLTNQNVSTFGYTGLIPHVTFDGTNWLSRVDGGATNWADISGAENYIDAGLRGLTIGGWFKFSNAAGAVEYLMSKDNIGANQRSYLLRRQVGGGILFGVSSLGTAASTVTVISTQTPAQSVWFCGIGRFVPNGSVDVFVNGEKTANVAGIPAFIFDSTAPFNIAAANGVPTLTGLGSRCFLAAGQWSDTYIRSFFELSKALYGVK